MSSPRGSSLWRRSDDGRPGGGGPGHLVQTGHLDMKIYEPGTRGPFRPGAIHEGPRCEDLQALTFADESFDLVVTSEVFDNLRNPALGFAEVLRVLRPGGRHVFTVPMTTPGRDALGDR